MTEYRITHKSTAQRRAQILLASLPKMVPIQDNALSGEPIQAFEDRGLV